MSRYGPAEPQYYAIAAATLSGPAPYSARLALPLKPQKRDNALGVAGIDLNGF